MAKKYVGALTVKALMEIIKNELGDVNVNVQELLTTVIKKEDVIYDLSQYVPPAEGEDPDGKVVSATIVKELTDVIDRLINGTPVVDGDGNPVVGEDGKPVYDKTNSAITSADIVKTWDGYDADADADKAIAAGLVKAIKDQVDAITSTVETELEGQKGQPGGIATLDEAGKVPADQLPSYVDDVLEGFLTETTTGEGDAAVTTRVFYEPNEDGTAASTTEIVGEKGKIYVDMATNYSYRWSGSTYVRINEVDLVEMSPEEVETLWNEVAAEFAGKEDVTNPVDPPNGGDESGSTQEPTTPIEPPTT